MGCMRLSATPEVGESPTAVLSAALAAGVRLLDTADVYGPDDGALGHNERLIASVLSTWTGDSVRVATKGGLTRPGGRWLPDGRAKHLRAACERSLHALGVPCIDLYQLHAVDPKTPLRTSARALERLQRDGLVRKVGLCNVTVEQIEEARRHVEVAAVQVALSPWDMSAVRGGVVAYCIEHGIELLLHSPLGGAKRKGRAEKDRVVADVATREAMPAGQVVLAWLRSLGPVTPLPGATRVVTGAACGATPSLSDKALADLDARFSVALQLRTPASSRRPSPDGDGDVVMTVGMQGVGKTVHAKGLVDAGYVRLNRDEAGSTLAKLHRKLDATLAAGNRRVVLDNTYPSRAIRNEVVEVAWRHGVPVRVLWMQAGVDDARIGVVDRMLAAHGGLLGPAEIRTLRNKDMTALPPSVHARYTAAFETPTEAEGFAVEPLAARAVVATGPSWVAVDIAVLRQLADTGDAAGSALKALGDPVVAVGWTPSDSDSVEEELPRWQQALGITLTASTCAHPAGPLQCWCRPPMPGLLCAAARMHGRTLGRCVFVGEGAFAERFAAACRVERFVAGSSLIGSAG